MGITIVTDSTSDLSKDLIEKYDIKIVPLTVNFENESFLDGVEIEPKDFFERLKNSKNLPTTSQVNPGQFIKIFTEILKEKNIVIGVFISSTLSGTYNSAVVAKETIGSEDIFLFDSKTSSIQLGLIASEAAKAAKLGKKVDEVIEIVKFSIENSRIVFMLDTLEYLRKGGRLTLSQAIIGNLLNLKLLMTVENGTITLLDKVRGKKKGVNWIKNYVEEKGIVLKNGPLAFVHGNSQENLLLLKETISEYQNIDHGEDYTMGAVIGTHLGPGCIGIGYIDTKN
jgi:DegV family protein with EDD domain